MSFEMKKFRKSRRRTRPRRFTRLIAELLEERRLLSPIHVINVNNSGAGSLRDAITQANNNPGLDIIDFSIPGSGVHTITPTFFLPVITDPVQIDGTTQQPGTDHPLIELDGSQAGNTNGLEI